MDYKAEVLNPKWWLIINAIGHAVIGVLLQMDPDNDVELTIAGVFLVIAGYMLYAAFMTTGRAQARLAAVIAGPFWVWLVMCIAHVDRDHQDHPSYRQLDVVVRVHL